MIESIECTPKQLQMLCSDADILLYGGAAGGGKSFAVLIDSMGLDTSVDKDGNMALSAIEDSSYAGLIIRKQYKHLTELIARSHQIFKAVDPGAYWLETKLTWNFSSGATISFLAIEDKEDAEVIQGRELTYIAIDELGQYQSSDVLEYCFSRLRNAKGRKCYLRATSNPSRYKWLREYFKIGASGKSTKYVRNITLPSGVEKKITIQYIQSLVTDNPHLSDDYHAKLAMLSEEERNALLHGRWDAYDTTDGAIYEAEIKAMVQDNRYCRVQHEPASDVHVYCDLGIHDTCVILFVQYIGKEMHVIDMLSGSNVAFIDSWIPKIKALAREKSYNIARLYLPHDAAAREKSSGMSIYNQAYSLMPSDILPRMSIADGIELAKTNFKRAYIDTKNCETLFDNIRVYRRKFDTRLGMYTDPIHDSSSHYADAFRYIWYNQPSTGGVSLKMPTGKSLW